VLFFLPWLDRSKVRSIRYKGWPSKIMLALFALGFIRLGMLGLAEGTPLQTLESRVWTAYYFAYFALLPFVTKFEKTKPEPERVTK